MHSKHEKYRIKANPVMHMGRLQGATEPPAVLEAHYAMLVRTCLASRSMLLPAARATSSNLSGNSAMISSVWVPMDPVLPSRENLYRMAHGHMHGKDIEASRSKREIDADRRLILNMRCWHTDLWRAPGLDLWWDDAHRPCRGHGHVLVVSLRDHHCAAVAGPSRSSCNALLHLHVGLL